MTQLRPAQHGGNSIPPFWILAPPAVLSRPRCKRGLQTRKLNGPKMGVIFLGGGKKQHVFLVGGSLADLICTS